MSGASSKGEWASGWPLVLACAVGMSLSSVSTFALGQFMAPIEHAFGWTRTQLSMGFSLSLMLAVVVSPVIGRITDLTNARTLALIGCVASGLAVAAFSLATGDLRLWVGLWVLHSACALMVSPVLWLSVIPGAFKSQRSLATALALAGNSLAATFVPVLARSLINSYDWRVAFQLLALIWYGGALILMALFFFDRRPREGRGRPAGAAHAPHAAQAVEGVAGEDQTSVWRVFRSPTFLKLAFVVFALKAMLAAYMIHMAPALVDHGFTPLDAAKIAAAVGVGTLAGKLSVGTLFDRLSVSTVSTGVMSVMAAACVLLAAFSGHTLGAVAACFALGVTDGAMLTIFACIAGRLFRPREFGVVFGSVSSMMALAVAVGPTVASMIHDRFGSYVLVDWAGLGVAALSLMILKSLESPPKPAAPAAVAAAE